MENKVPKVFISYSWSPKENKNKVLRLADRLISNEIKVIIDINDLKPGQDKHFFMEKNLDDKEICKVLIICNKDYMEKADERKGGVGTETEIITPQIYGKIDQERIIPIVFEKSPEGEAYLPIYLKTRKYIDLSEENFGEGYKELLENIRYSSNIDSSSTISSVDINIEKTNLNLKTTEIIKKIKKITTSNPNLILPLSKEFYSEFIKTLEQFRIKYYEEPDKPYNERVLESIDEMLPLKNDFISFIQLFYEEGINIDNSLLAKFLENILIDTWPKKNIGAYTDSDFDNYKFLKWELFLYLVTILIENEDYSTLSYILKRDYSFYIQDKKVNYKYQIFYIYPESIKETLGKKFLERLPEKYDSEILVTTDLILYYLASFHDTYWYPFLYRQSGLFNMKIEFFERLESREHCEKVKEVFGAINLENLRYKITNHVLYDFKEHFLFAYPIQEYIPPNKLATLT